MLGRTMDTAAHFAKRIDVERDDVAARIMSRQGVLCDFIGFAVSELSGNDTAVTHVVICVRGHKVDAFNPAMLRFRNDLDLKTFGDAPVNEHPIALAAAVSRLHGLADATLIRLIAPDHESPVSLYEYCETQTQTLGKLTQTIRGEIDACNKRLPGVSAELD